ncbi:MAG: hypothetical protein KDE48_22460 [Anaerolineales bacterium]|nr:hypothetical protein [Anaerolineales bacterium]
MTKVNAIRQRIGGKLLTSDGQTALILENLRVDKDTHNVVFLRYALVTKGSEEHIFPAFLMDDWGHEVHGLKLYAWVSENGARFPRGEIFGFEQDGRETQCFLRELELYARLPCYAYPSADSAVETGSLLDAILLPAMAVDAAVRIKRPSELKRPLRTARVSWWQIPAKTHNFDFSLLVEPPNPGY